MSRKKPNFFVRFIFLLNNLLAIATLLAYAAWFINPSALAIAGIVALTVPVLIALNALFVLFWLFIYKRYMLLSLIIIALGFWHLSGLIGLSTPKENIENEGDFRVMSYNVRSFHFPGPYLWHDTPPNIGKLNAALNPDIVCMQEYLPGGNWQPNFHHKHRFVGNKKEMTLAIYSTFPFIETHQIDWPKRCGEYNGFLAADLIINSDTVRVINVHLMSIGINPNDLSKLKNIENEDAVEKSTRQILNQLLNAYETRGMQVEFLDEYIKESPYPVILCGDLNDTPTTYTYRTLTNTLNDSFRHNGFGFGTSHVKFSRNQIPLRIDHILTSAEIEATNWQVVRKEYSDHYPVYADFNIKVTAE